MQIMEKINIFFSKFEYRNRLNCHFVFCCFSRWHRLFEKFQEIYKKKFLILNFDNENIFGSFCILKHLTTHQGFNDDDYYHHRFLSSSLSSIKELMAAQRRFDIFGCQHNRYFFLFFGRLLNDDFDNLWIP